MRQLMFDSAIVQESSRDSAIIQKSGQDSIFTIISRHEFGGSILSRNKKSLRPLCSKRALHLVLKADRSISGSLRSFQVGIANLLAKYSSRFGVKIYKYAICGNHIHIVLRVPDRIVYRAWIRTVTGRMAINFKVKWGLSPWSRILSWGREFKTVIKYVLQNTLEAEGIIEYKGRVKQYRKRR